MQYTASEMASLAKKMKESKYYPLDEIMEKIKECAGRGKYNCFIPNENFNPIYFEILKNLGYKATQVLGTNTTAISF